MLTRNCWVEKGLCNGSMGVVRGIIYLDSQCPPSLPLTKVVEFGDYAGPIFSHLIQSLCQSAPILGKKSIRLSHAALPFYFC